MKKILIIEDDSSLSAELKILLNNAGYEANILKDFGNVPELVKNLKPDLILLDINLPLINGDVLLQSIRKESNIPIIMVTSRNTKTDEILSMSYGADDYITKPYDPNLLLLRINAVLRRVGEVNNIFTYKDLTINIPKGLVTKENITIVLTKNEMIILSFLLNNQNRIVSRDELMTALWDNNEYINDNALTVNISRLRGKLKELGYEDMIETRKKIGYILS